MVCANLFKDLLGQFRFSPYDSQRELIEQPGGGRIFCRHSRVSRQMEILDGLVATAREIRQHSVDLCFIKFPGVFKVVAANQLQAGLPGSPAGLSCRGQLQ